MISSQLEHLKIICHSSNFYKNTVLIDVHDELADLLTSTDDDFRPNRDVL